MHGWSIVHWRRLTGLPTLRGLAVGDGLLPANYTSFIVAIYMWSVALDSPVRYGLSLIHLAALIYLRDALLISLLLVEIFLAIRVRRIHAGLLVGFSILAFHSIVGLVVSRNVPMTVFGMKAFLPLAAGLVVGVRLLDDEMEDGFARMMFWIWVVTVAGIVLDAAKVPFPWRGFSLEVGGVHVEGNRQWSTVGVSRLAGFTRASFDAAVLLSVLPFFFVLRRRLFARYAVLFVSMVGIVLTVTKGILIGYLAALATTVLVEFRLPWKRIVFVLALAAGIGAMVGLPLFFEGQTLNVYRGDPVQEFLFGSFRERINSTWPDAWSFLSEPAVSLMGTGLGGIGAAQKIFDNSRAFQPGDNMFIYLRVIMGILAYPYLAYLTWNAVSAKPYEKARGASILLVQLFFAGVSLSVPESSVGGIVIGILAVPSAGGLNRRLRIGSRIPP
jgi:hypothetical protein